MFTWAAFPVMLEARLDKTGHSADELFPLSDDFRLLHLMRIWSL